ncbi:hypothetical protein AnigIFM62618_002035 [Aspergillus niger]|nr:hypothetical protein AnigIFM62618_002035 [Aspergillus niger]
MGSRLVCPLCGSFLDQDRLRNVPGPWHWGIRLWSTEVRGLYAVDDDTGRIAVTGVGVIRNHNIVHASVDQDQAYFDVADFNALDLWVIRDFSVNRGCFAFHNSCWKLLLLRLRQGNAFIDDATILRSVFDQLYYSPAPEAPGPEDSSQYFGFADPCAIFSLDQLESIRRDERGPIPPRGMEPGSDDERHSCHNTWSQVSVLESGYNIFSRLPDEMLFEVLTYLSYRQVQNIRLTCRYLNWRVRNAKLPQSYWRSRFMLGQEFDFIFPGLRTSRDWYKLYAGTKAYSRSSPRALTNRREICQRLEHIAFLVELEPTKRNGGQGFSYRPEKSRRNIPVLVDIAISTGDHLRAKVMLYFSGHLTSAEAHCPLQDECPLLYRKAQSLVALRNRRQLRIGISTVKLGSRHFISGIKLFPAGDRSGISHSIGYPNPDTEEWIDIPRGSHIRAFEVHFSPEGLRAIRILCANLGESHWVGKPDIKGTARGILSIPGGKEPYYLLAGLDRFKIVALGFGEVAKPYKHAPKPVHSSAANTLPSRADSHLWMPPVSLHMSSFISPLLPCRPSGPFNPLLNFDFGGRRGLRLRDLTTLEFHLRFHRHPLVGMVARYSHGNVVKCGVVGENVMSFFLDSSNGERITQIRVLRDNRYHTRAVRLVGLEVSTNYGRTATFAPLFHRLNASVRTISGVPPRHTITGIVVQPAAYRKYFEQLRIHSQFCIALPAIPHNLDSECHRVPEDQIQYDLMLHHNSSEKNDMKCYQTYASLKGVRTITASTGNTHYSRSRHWITGLKIEYYNHPSPNVVGQWIRPLHGEVLELDPGEEIKSITVWVGFDSFISQFPELSTGNIAAIWIDAGMHWARFSTPIFRSGAVIQSQYLRDADKELTAISWVVSAKSDRVRAVMSPYGSQRPRTLMPTLSPPYDRVRKLYFKRQGGSSRGRKIVKAEACIYGDEISGLRFTYQSRNQAAVGDTRSGMTRQVVEFSNTDIIMGLSVKTSGTALLEIQFEVERDGTQRCLSLGIPNDQRSQCDRHLYWGDIPANVETASDISEQEPMDKIYKPPKDSKLIGIYVDCDCISEIGAIYEPERSQ